MKEGRGEVNFSSNKIDDFSFKFYFSLLFSHILMKCLKRMALNDDEDWVLQTTLKMAVSMIMSFISDMILDPWGKFYTHVSYFFTHPNLPIQDQNDLNLSFEVAV